MPDRLVLSARAPSTNVLVIVVRAHVHDDSRPAAMASPILPFVQPTARIGEKVAPQTHVLRSSCRK